MPGRAIGRTSANEIVSRPKNRKRWIANAARLPSSNANVGGDYLIQGQTVQMVRGVGLLGDGQDPLLTAMTKATPDEAVAYLRAEEQSRIEEIRQIVLTSVRKASLPLA